MEFRVWNSITKQMLGNYSACESLYKQSYGHKVMRSLELEDCINRIIFESDIVQYEGRLYKVCCEGWRCTLNQSLSVNGRNETIVVDEDVLYGCEYKGNVYENEDLWK